MNNASFLDLFCESFNCLPEDFNETVLWVCLFPHALFLARLLWRVNRDYFKPDLELIEQVKDLTDPTEVRAEFDDFHYRHPSTGLFRGLFKVRVSGQRLLDLTNRLFARAGAR